ncbi:hypothetical protein OIO90_001206 [Microbotryomycetes sp. JL221]|nr:hypothetical protein OIO90_001206 [Microbotryomycetes sp. JL221]
MGYARAEPEYVTEYDIDPDAPLISEGSLNAKFSRTVSLPVMRQLDERVVLVGSLFGTGRIALRDDDMNEWRHMISVALAFNSPWLLRPADAIAGLIAALSGSYLGIHARVGDGRFGRHAHDNMIDLWSDLTSRMDVSQDVRSLVVGRRDDGPSLEVKVSNLGSHSNSSSSPVRRLQQEDESTWWPLGWLRKTTKSGLECRSPPHTDPALQPFNEPLFIATDSPDPDHDPALSIFFETFPCAFIMADFDRDSLHVPAAPLRQVQEMLALVNENDGVGLGRHFTPFVEAIVAAKARITVGTARSTFSSFTQGALHDAYHNHSGSSVSELD